MSICSYMLHLFKVLVWGKVNKNPSNWRTKAREYSKSFSRALVLHDNIVCPAFAMQPPIRIKSTNIIGFGCSWQSKPRCHPPTHNKTAFPFGFIRKPFGWYIKVYPVPEGGKLSLTAGGVSAANVTCGKSKLLQPSPKGANGVLGYAVAGSYGYAVCPYTPITV